MCTDRPLNGYSGAAARTNSLSISLAGFISDTLIVRNSSCPRMYLMPVRAAP
jgi:hypothetical protein